jgi:hypothetical protein
MPITVSITFYDLVDLPYDDKVDQLDREFPGIHGANSLLIRHPLENMVELILKAQEELTQEQQRWLHLWPFAMQYIQSFTTVPSPATTFKEAADIVRKRDKAFFEAYILLSGVPSDLSAQDGDTRAWIERRAAWLKAVRKENTDDRKGS